MPDDDLGRFDFHALFPCTAKPPISSHGPIDCPQPRRGKRGNDFRRILDNLPRGLADLSRDAKFVAQHVLHELSLPSGACTTRIQEDTTVFRSVLNRLSLRHCLHMLPMEGRHVLGKASWACGCDHRRRDNFIIGCIYKESPRSMDRGGKGPMDTATPGPGNVSTEYLSRAKKKNPLRKQAICTTWILVNCLPWQLKLRQIP